MILNDFFFVLNSLFVRKKFALHAQGWFCVVVGARWAYSGWCGQRRGEGREHVLRAHVVVPSAPLLSSIVPARMNNCVRSE